MAFSANMDSYDYGNQGTEVSPVEMPFYLLSFPLRILVRQDLVGSIMGPDGVIMHQITVVSGAKIDVERSEYPLDLGENQSILSVRTINIYGHDYNIATAIKQMLLLMQEEACNANLGEIPLRILAHGNMIEKITRKDEDLLTFIMDQTETTITVSSGHHEVNNLNMEQIITVTGQIENICQAQQLIRQKLHQIHEDDLAAMAPHALMYPGLHPMAMMSTSSDLVSSNNGDPSPPLPSPCDVIDNIPPQQDTPQPQNINLGEETVIIYVPHAFIGAIIGEGDSTIRDIVKSSGATIHVPTTNKDEPVDPKFEGKVTIVGTAKAQWKAQCLIFKTVQEFRIKLKEEPQEYQLKVEIYVPSSQVGRIIGKDEQTLRELERKLHAIIKLPEEKDNPESEETPIHIIGDFCSTQAAQYQIRSLVNKNLVPGAYSSGVQPSHHQSSN